ncbi:hypothetical protein BTH42_33235 [Burkholderia sp. SRS-W-2-2016]|uniref:hypothetical protein n=1 Tax=Burkholderia sp. SRS-W-2-2016 TaxID=1926878 RepID=UPI00094B279E|nr:hypothetical protein [Burkholderia sp. SRS-W-2-2016]OLL27364.1 hypothetical protein BTH42_33235 [Burkholderia sp. SRS-W-2-2016]
MRDQSIPFLIAAARGALEAGYWASAVALGSAGAGCWIAAGWQHVPLERVLLASVSIMFGVAALWYAVRIAIDRRLFAALADHPRLQEGEVDDTLAGLDEALIALGWINAEKVRRPPGARVRGAIRLLWGSVVIAIMQWLVVGIAIAARGL